MNPKVDEFIEHETKWKAEFEKLREIVLRSELAEEIKWGVPCYALNGKNVAIIHGFKEYCAILFVKGSLLRDDAKVLIQQTDHVQAGRQIRFKNLGEILALEGSIEAYLREAIENERAGMKVERKTTSEYGIVPEFKSRLDSMGELRDAFNALTPGRQKAYLLYFGSAKQPKTRESRVEKCIPRILDGFGLDD